MVKADPDEHDRYRVQGSSLHSMSKKRLAQEKGKGITSTFRRKPGQRPLQHKRQVFGVTVKRVRSTGYTFKRGKPIARDGVRGRRLLAADAKARAKVKNLPCLCGCNCTKPQWMHLKGRADLRYRHEDWATAPGCEHLHGWLDQGRGVKARGEMFELAKTLGRRLEHADVYSLLVDHGYYAELDRKRAMER